MFQDHSVHTLPADRLPFVFDPVDTGCIRCFPGGPFGVGELHTERSSSPSAQNVFHLSWDSLVSQPFSYDFPPFPLPGEEVARPRVREWFRVWNRSQIFHYFSDPTLRVKIPTRT